MVHRGVSRPSIACPCRLSLLGATLISLNLRCKAAAYDFYVFSALLIVEWFLKFSGRIYLDNETTSSQRGGNGWFLRHFVSRWLSPHIKKSTKLVTKHVPIWVHGLHPPPTFKIKDHCCLETTLSQRRYGKGRKGGDLHLPKRPWPRSTLSTSISSFLRGPRTSK